MDVIVTSCRNACPFFKTEGMERMMYCGHPYWQTVSDPYACMIINQDNSNGRVPDACPLRKGPHTSTTTVRLK